MCHGAAGFGSSSFHTPATRAPVSSLLPPGLAPLSSLENGVTSFHLKQSSSQPPRPPQPAPLAESPGKRALGFRVSPAASGGFLTTWPNCMCQHPQWPPCDAKPWSLSPFYPKLFTRCSNPWKHYQGDAEAGVQPPFCRLHLRIEIHLNVMALIPKYSSPPLRKAAFSMAQCQHQPPMNSINI